MYLFLLPVSILATRGSVLAKIADVVVVGSEGEEEEEEGRDYLTLERSMQYVLQAYSFAEGKRGKGGAGRKRLVSLAGIPPFSLPLPLEQLSILFFFLFLSSPSLVTFVARFFFCRRRRERYRPPPPPPPPPPPRGAETDGDGDGSGVAKFSALLTAPLLCVLCTCVGSIYRMPWDGQHHPNKRTDNRNFLSFSVSFFSRSTTAFLVLALNILTFLSPHFLIT